MMHVGVLVRSMSVIQFGKKFEMKFGGSAKLLRERRQKQVMEGAGRRAVGGGQWKGWQDGLGVCGGRATGAWWGSGAEEGKALE